MPRIRNHTVEITKFINDNVYGGIGFTDKEFAIINTPTFQRLRRIKQQGLTNLTFPSSDHTRFSHSLGVLHIMGKIIERLNELEGMNPRERKLLRYAALLHDIGHYPLSHLTETVYGSRTGLTRPQVQSPLTIFWKKYNVGRAHHERLGVEVLKRRKDIRLLLKEDGFEPEEIGEIITGDTGNQLHHQLMHSSLDADRLDYLLRDSAAAGVNYGLIDLDYLIRLMNIGTAALNFGRYSENVKAVGVNVKGIHTLEHYLMARYFSYSQVTLHRTTSVFESLAKTLIWYLAENNSIYPDYNSIKKIVGRKEFLAFDDSYLWNRIGNKNLFRNDPVHAFYRDVLIERKKIKVLFELKEIRQKGLTPDPRTNYIKLKSEAERNLALFATALNIPIERVGYIEQRMSIDKSTNEIFNDDIDLKEAPRVIVNNKAELLVDQQSCLIKEMFDKELFIFRIFYLDPWPYDKGKSEQLVKSVRERIQQTLGIS